MNTRGESGPDGVLEPAWSVSDKPTLRKRILDSRTEVTAAVREGEAAALAATMHSLAVDGTTVCAYVPIGTEPGSVEMLDALVGAGARVLLPITGEPGPLHWSVFEGSGGLQRARYGLLEPVGPVLDPAEIGTATTILVPALAVDRRGVRLGRGAGFYDRSLSMAGKNVQVAAVVRDSEVVSELPEDPHDVRVGWSLTPAAGLVRLLGE